MKRLMILAAVLAALMTGCQGNSNSNSANNAAVKPDKIKVADVVKAFRDAGLPLNQIQFFNAASDPDKLLGQPNQYIGKATWQTTDKMIHMIEEFNAEADLQAAKTKMETPLQPGAKTDYIYTYKNILLRLNFQLVPETAARYEQALKSL